MSYKSVSLRKWMWRAFVQSALIPLILVETVLVAAYLLSNSAIRDAQVEHLRSAALTDLQAAANQEARLISERLQTVRELTDLFSAQVAEALSRPDFLDDPAERQRLARTDTGVLYSESDENRPASFYSSVTPQGRQDVEKILRLAGLDGFMRTIERSNALVAAVYFNSHDSYNRIWPWFYTPSQYPHDMDIPQYNFYYLADAEHNPERRVVWTDSYLDPAGLGWMMSALSPVYDGDFLEGVVGLDITVGNLLNEIAQLQVPWGGYAMLVSEDLNIMALPAQGERDLQLTELTEYSHHEAIRQEIFKPGDFNLVQRLDMRELGYRLEEQDQGVIALSLDGRPKLAAWATVPETGWHLLTVVDEAAIFAQTNQLARHYRNIGLLLIVGLILFYLLFFAGMWIRSRQLSRQLQRPIEGIGEMMREIGRGHWHPHAEPTRIIELESMAETTRQVGQQLAELEDGRREARAQIDQVLESTTESLWEVDVADELIRFQGRLPERLDLGTHTLALRDFLRRVHPDDLLSARASLLPDDERRKIEAEYRLRDAAGRYHWVLGRGRVARRDPAGRPLMIAGTHVDIGALKATEQALRSASQQAQAANLAKSRFLSSMSHELRTPLNIIQGFAQLLQLDLSPGPEHHRFRHQVEEILKATHHLALLVEDVLDLARIEAERPEIKLQTVDGCDVLHECVEQVRPEIDAAGLRLVMHAPDRGVLVTAEPRRLRQILLNLLSNAIKYNSERGTITIDCLAIQDRWQLCVRDTGQGISRLHQRQLFKPFQRLGHENGPIKGTGIGLSLSRELAGLMGGQLGYTSEEGAGSCFWLELPAAAPAGAGGKAGTLPEDQLLDVVYVEDDRSSRILVEHALADLARVTLIANGLEALHRIGERPPQLLLLDIDLPDMQGDRLLRSLRSSERTRDLPVIIISAGVTPANRERVADLDVAVYLTKPLQIQDLRDAVIEVARLQSGNR
ncbi:Signal transduction histidine kinase [Halopseudomonas xinjiangensis]|uniref:histidine kinase n=1 Tax=Halopseudomonas xinjiangensis TaxID=487184 RepID=A0A1H1LD40_9GAMM|nr:ATP-binding protein [Halopseudomonas xinjiangensis]SDR71769.1 Signal transduction histidine kinase [Halopseudomonas xinjiangensis]